jgi:hypothetical protein
MRSSAKIKAMFMPSKKHPWAGRSSLLEMSALNGNPALLGLRKPT